MPAVTLGQPKKKTGYKSPDRQASRKKTFGETMFGTKQGNAVASAQYKRSMGINPAAKKLSNAEAAQSSQSMGNPTGEPQRLGTSKANLPRLGSMTAKKPNKFAATGPMKDVKVARGLTPDYVRSKVAASKVGGGSIPKATGAESVAPSHGAGGYPAKKAAPSHGGGSYPSKATTAAPASSTSDTKFVSKSSSPPAYQAPVAGVKRGGVETRYQRDSGLAMDSRKRK